jgi:hypothetical protein
MGLVIDGNQPNLGPSTPIILVSYISKDFKASVNIHFYCKLKTITLVEISYNIQKTLG